MEDHSIVSIIIIVILGILLFVGISALCDNEGVADYNGGICKLCGGHYAYNTTIGHAYTTEYIYICNDCSNLIGVGTYMGK